MTPIYLRSKRFSREQSAYTWLPAAVERGENITVGGNSQDGIFSAVDPQAVLLSEPSSAGNQPPCVFNQERAQSLYPNGIYHNTWQPTDENTTGGENRHNELPWPPVEEIVEELIADQIPLDTLLGEFFISGLPATFLEPLPASNGSIQRQQDQPLYPYKGGSAPLFAPELDGGLLYMDSEIVSAAEFPAALSLEPPSAGNELTSIHEQNYPLGVNNPTAWLPIVNNILNAGGLHAEPSCGPEPTNPQTPPGAIPFETNNAVNGARNRQRQEFHCENRCRSIFAPHNCSYSSGSLVVVCHNCLFEFSRRNDFNRHYDTIHRDAQRLWDCPVPGCNRVGSRGFKRKDNLRQHRRLVHQENIVKNPIRFGR